LPLPRTLARWNKAGLNRVTKRVAPWMPGVRLVSPQLVHDENRRGIRPVERQVLRLIGGRLSACRPRARPGLGSDRPVPLPLCLPRQLA
jgi:hypothetical protein